MSGFVQAMEWLLPTEGGYTVDQGGPTYQGVTQTNYDVYRDRSAKPRRDVRLMEPNERDHLYFESYWLAAKCDALPWPLSLVHFDVSVNSGPVQAIRLLQRAIGAEADGQWGPETKAKAQEAIGSDEWSALNNMLWERAALFTDLAQKPQHKASYRGWMVRLLRLRERASADLL